jgi:hypothetical protein
VHPITCVPHLIALEMDPVEGNSKLAHHLLMNMNEKYAIQLLLFMFPFFLTELSDICWELFAGTLHFLKAA